MAKVCEMCGKGYLKGNIVCFSNKKSIKRSYPNIRSAKVNVDGRNIKLKLCTGCLSALKRAQAAEKIEVANIVAEA
jgi:large subunit ribosomal protein L28